MKIKISNLGAMRHAEFSLGDMTIICGGNNTGKTYATYALFGFLSTWREGTPIQVSVKVIDQLFSDGAVHIDINEYTKDALQILTKGCEAYTKRLPLVFAAQEEKFRDSKFIVSVRPDEIHTSQDYERRIRTANAELFSITKTESSSDLVVTLLVEKEKLKIPRDAISRAIGDALKDIVFGHLIPNPFIASAERTGAAIFRKDLNFARNRLLEEIAQPDKVINPLDLFFKSYQDYALPVKSNVDFTRQLESLSKKTSFITEKHPEILIDFADIIGGEYQVSRNDELFYIPKGNKRIKLTMDESSSAVRSLLDIGFYLKHMAKPGDLLMVDEPELNLHPENQRSVARLFARLVNIGVKVFITTHSDYIIKEINTLIMLERKTPHLMKIAKDEGYKPSELINSNRIRVYIAEDAMVIPDGGKNKVRCNTLTQADIDPILGIEARSFDQTIETMNRIQDAIVWSDETNV